MKSLKSLLLIHELTFFLLVTVTGLLSGLSAYYWNQTSSESVRINNLIYLTEQIRSELFRQLREVTRARILEDRNAIGLYTDYSRRIDTHFNQLRQNSASRDEDVAIQKMQTAYREIQQDMNKIFGDPYSVNYVVRLKVLDPRFSDHMVGKFETHYGSFKKLLTTKHNELELVIERWTRFAPILIPIFLLMAILLVFYSRRILRTGFVRPMATVIQGATEISQGKLQHRVPENGVAEVAELANSINQMADDLTISRDALVDSEKQAALGALVPVVAHNIRNPLASIRATAQVLDEVGDKKELNEGKLAIIETIDRLGRWVNALVSYLHPLKPHLQNIQATDLVEDTIKLLKPKLEEKNINVEKINWDKGIELSVDADLMEQAFYGLLANAIEASADGDTLTIALDNTSQHFTFRIRDYGPGLPFEPRSEKLEPGPSTKRFGTGLGIPIAYKICESHGWELNFNTTPGTGTEVDISVPRKQNSEAKQNNE